MNDWPTWHAQYDDPTSPLSRRLLVVQRLLRLLLDGTGRRHRILSLCAGDARDVVPVLADRPVERRPQLTLVELNPELAAAARDRAAQAGVTATVTVGDAGLASTWGACLPVDILMLCGVFGNVSDDDIRRTISATPALLTTRGKVIWTRGAFESRDIRQHVRQWFQDAGFDELGYESEPNGYGVGACRLGSGPEIGELPARLFTFIR